MSDKLYFEKQLKRVKVPDPVFGHTEEELSQYVKSATDNYNRKLGALLDEDRDSNTLSNIIEFFTSPEAIKVALVIVAVIVAVAILVSVSNSCDGVLVRTMFGYDCIEGRK
jgi:hypothetical protein